MATMLPPKEVVIVGGGLSAGLIARRLVPLGREVLVLERGPDRGGAEGELPSQRDDLRWNIRRELIQKEQIETYTLRHSPGEEALPMRQLTGFLPGFGVGGGAVHWNGQHWRFQPSDMNLLTHLRQRYGANAVPEELTLQDWGISYDELEPYYQQLEDLFGVSGKAGNIDGVPQQGGNPFEPRRTKEYPNPPLEPTEAGLIFARAAESLGYKPFPMPAANASRPYTNPDGVRLGQCQYCGHCERFVCEANAKASPHILFFPLVRGRPNFELRTHAEVYELVYDRPGRRVTGVRYVDAQTGIEYEQPAGTVVLASYVLSNTRLMLLSRIGEPYDPRTGRGVVGKNYCYQTTSGVGVFFRDRDFSPYIGTGARGMVIDEFNCDNFDHSGLGFFGGGYISATITNGRPIGNRPLPPGTPRWGTAWKRANAEWYGKFMNIGCHGTSYSHRNNYMDLDPDYRDAYGRPLLRITFDFPENDIRMSAWTTQKCHEIARATGADIVGSPAPRTRPYDARAYQSTHNTGGTICGTDPATSVVSPHLQCWDAENLFITGASVFPQNSGYNPTGPVGALALRLADTLAGYLERPRRL
ncbi:MAG: GMC family oxidoreductase [Acetobacteraceae bacterium]|nr:GMC family oxidoreductase [Acetobacteraceae bacterium]MDW8398776.1 GMC family oxidoreductase [Acetobacteraceae bacterium]